MKVKEVHIGITEEKECEKANFYDLWENEKPFYTGIRTHDCGHRGNKKLAPKGKIILSENTTSYLDLIYNGYTKKLFV